MIYLHNGQEVHRESAWTLRLWRICIKYGSCDTHITGLTINGQPVEDFEISGNVQIETPKSSTVSYTVHVGNGCDSTLPNGIEPKKIIMIAQTDHDGYESDLEQLNSQLSVRSEGGTANVFDAVLDRDKSGPATLMVFDASGRLVFQGEMEGDFIKTRQFSVPSQGVYIVKAITADGEHTQKIIAN